MKLSKSLLVFFIFSFANLHSQKNISIEEILETMIYKTDEYNTIQKNSIIQNEEYNIINNNFLPKISLELNVPNYDHSINVITQPNGDNIFIDRQQANSSMVFDISQPIFFSGGYFNIKSSLNRVDLISRKQVEYSSNWFNIGFVQPINGYNQFKWMKKINESNYNFNKAEQIRKIENLRIELIERYFEVLILQLKTELTTKNIELKEEKIKNSTALFENGRILEAELFQEKISLNQLKITLEQQKNQYEIEINKFKNILNISNSDLVLTKPQDIGFHYYNVSLLKEKIKKYGIDIYLRSNFLQAESEYKKAKSERGVQINLQLAYGTNSVNNSLDGLFEIPSKREYANLNLKIPILNWNENKRKMIIAKEKMEIIENNIKISSEELDVKVFETINYMKSLENQNDIFLQNIELLQKNIDVVKNLYKYNRITLSEFDYQLFNEETIRVDYLNNLKALWLNRYQLRKLTLYDFYENKELN
jgi:hypothetical protein